ncbi:MAG: hypothetical protein JSU80_13870 [Deltaproteobacteria bacterium]|nr:MAG: hypothetical protein JSU80_13870 [Deltaproteobacteria bacterium]
MKKLIISFIFVLTFLGCATKGTQPSQESGEKPDVFCNVIQRPDPLLMGTWECNFSRVRSDLTKLDKNYVKYRLIKYDDKYALYFDRTWRSGRKKIREWKNWDINGQEISGPYGVRIFVAGSDVYFTIRGLDEPAKMTRIEG